MFTAMSSYIYIIIQVHGSEWLSCKAGIKRSTGVASKGTLRNILTTGKEALRVVNRLV